jgi:hypothetical protein
MLPAISVRRRLRRLVARVPDAEAHQSPDWTPVQPVADDAQLRQLREQLGRELERVARGQETAER